MYQYQFELSVADYEEYNVHITSKGLKNLNKLRYVMGGLAIIFAFFQFYQRSFVLASSHIIILVVAIWWMFGLKWQVMYSAKKRMRDMLKAARLGTLTGYTEIVINELGIKSTSQHTESWVKWGAVQSVESSKTQVLIMLSGNSGYIIPKREISGGEPAQKQLVDFIQTQINGSYNKEEVAEHLVG